MYSASNNIIFIRMHLCFTNLLTVQVSNVTDENDDDDDNLFIVIGGVVGGIVVAVVIVSLTAIIIVLCIRYVLMYSK